MSSLLTIKIDGEGLLLHSLGETLSATNSLLRELDRIISNEHTLEWSLTGLAFGSAEIAVAPRPLAENFADCSGEVLQLFAEGMVSLESSGSRPARYTDKALQSAKKVSSIAKQVERLSFCTHIDSRPDTVFTISPQVGVSVDEILSKKKLRAFGSVEGVVEIIHGVEDYFEIVDGLGNRRIRCHVGKGALEAISRLYFEKRLIVSGEITEDQQGHPKEIAVKHYRPLIPRENLPSPRDLLGLYASLPNG